MDDFKQQCQIDLNEYSFLDTETCITEKITLCTHCLTKFMIPKGYVQLAYPRYFGPIYAYPKDSEKPKSKEIIFKNFEFIDEFKQYNLYDYYLDIHSDPKSKPMSYEKLSKFHHKIPEKMDVSELCLTLTDVYFQHKKDEAEMNIANYRDYKTNFRRQYKRPRGLQYRSYSKRHDIPELKRIKKC